MDMPGSRAARRDSGCEGERTVSDAGGGRCLAEEPNQGGEVGPDIGEEDESLAAGVTIDGKPFEPPALEGSVAALGGVAGAVVELLPRRGTDGDVADKAARSIVFEEEAYVEDLAVVGVGVEMGALGGMIGQALDGDDGFASVLTSATAEPLVTVFVEVEAVGGERVTKGADRTPLVVIAAQRPQSLVPVGLMGAQIDHSAGFEDLPNDVQDTGIAEGGITRDVFDVEGRMERGKLEELSGKRDFLTGIGRGEVVSQDDVEAARGIGEEERETGVTVAWLALIGTTFIDL